MSSVEDLITNPIEEEKEPNVLSLVDVASTPIVNLSDDEINDFSELLTLDARASQLINDIAVTESQKTRTELAEGLFENFFDVITHEILRSIMTDELIGNDRNRRLAELDNAMSGISSKTKCEIFRICGEGPLIEAVSTKDRVRIESKIRHNIEKRLDKTGVDREEMTKILKIESVLDMGLAENIIQTNILENAWKQDAIYRFRNKVLKMLNKHHGNTIYRIKNSIYEESITIDDLRIIVEEEINKIINEINNLLERSGFDGLISGSRAKTKAKIAQTIRAILKTQIDALITELQTCISNSTPENDLSINTSRAAHNQLENLRGEIMGAILITTMSPEDIESADHNSNLVANSRKKIGYILHQLEKLLDKLDSSYFPATSTLKEIVDKGKDLFS